MPEEETEPTEGEIDHVTPVLEVPLTVAVNCCVPLGPSVTVPGDTATPTVGAGVTLMVDVSVAEFSEAEI